MLQYFPGTVTEKNGRSAKELFEDVFEKNDGIMLMTVRNITGLDTPTLQNWVHRGWVKRPVHKKYSVDHLARILIINALRPVTSMENIATVLNTVCGSVDGSREGIVSDALFYEYFVDASERVEYGELEPGSDIDKTVSETIADYDAPNPVAKDLLHRCIRIFVLFIASELLRGRANSAIAELN